MLEDVDKYRYLNNGYICLPNVDDAAEFHNTVRSMKIMGFQDEEITCKPLLHLVMKCNWNYIIFHFYIIFKLFLVDVQYF